MPNQYTSPVLSDRFWAKVDKSAGPLRCWPWTGAKFHFGHGAVKVNGRPWGTHRIAWELTHGDIPTTLRVLHKCDNPPCCNPAHLYLGTLKDNTADMWARGRANPRFGDGHPRAKLTAALVYAARQQVRRGARVSDVSRQLGVSTSALWSAVRGRTWRHVADPVKP